MSSPLNPYQSPQPDPPADQAQLRESTLERAIHVAGKLTVDEGREAERLARRTVLRRGLSAFGWTVLSVIIMLLVVGAIARPDSAAAIILVLIGATGVILLGAGIGLTRIQMRSAWRRETGIFAPYQATISENEVELLRGTATFRLRWLSFAGYRNTDQVAVLYFDFPKRYWVLARPHFSDDGRWNLFLDVLRRKLPRL